MEDKCVICNEFAIEIYCEKHTCFNNINCGFANVNDKMCIGKCRLLCEFYFCDEEVENRDIYCEECCMYDQCKICYSVNDLMTRKICSLCECADDGCKNPGYQDNKKTTTILQDICKENYNMSLSDLSANLIIAYAAIANKYCNLHQKIQLGNY